MNKKYYEYINKKHNFDKTTMLGIFSLIIVISGIFGFIYEYIFYYFNSGMKEFYWRGGNFLPWISIYAIGGILIYMLTYKYRKSPMKVFAISSISCGIIEYISGLGIYLLYNGDRYWDYNTEILNIGNIGGFICLRSVLFFGLSSLFLMYVIIPFCFNLAKKMNKKTFLIITISICTIILLDELYNFFANSVSLPSSIDIYKKIGFHYIDFNYK